MSHPNSQRLRKKHHYCQAGLHIQTLPKMVVKLELMRSGRATPTLEGYPGGRRHQ
jgi:hypothetical protein